MKIVIVGNGILGLTSALQILKKEPQSKIDIVGPEDHRGCASLAAAAMLNSFCEIDSNTLKNKIEKQKFLFNRAATSLWPEFLNFIETESNSEINYGFGTYVIDNHSTDELEDENFLSIVDGLKEFNEPFDFILPKEIPKYNPAPQSRAARALYIPNEGYLNPVMLIASLKKYLRSFRNIRFIHQACIKLNTSVNKVDSALLTNNEIVTGDKFILSPGATFSEIVNNSNLGINFPRVFYGIGCSLLLKTDDNTLESCIRTPNRGLACGLYSAPFDKNHIVVGASNFISPVPEDNVRLTSVHTLLDGIIQQLNKVFYKAQLVKINVGWRPTSADTVPLIGQTSLSNLIVATGTKRDGLHCSPLISQILSELIFSGQSSYDISLFKPERNLIRIYTRDESINIAVKHTINAAYQHGFKPSQGTMTDDLLKYYTQDYLLVHNQAGATDWGIPPEMINMYRYGHI